MGDIVNIMVTYKLKQSIILNSIIKCEESTSETNFQMIIENNLKKKHKYYKIVRFCTIDSTFDAEVDINFDDAFFIVDKQKFIIYLEEVSIF